MGGSGKGAKERLSAVPGWSERYRRRTPKISCAWFRDPRDSTRSKSLHGQLNQYLHQRNVSPFYLSSRFNNFPKCILWYAVKPDPCSIYCLTHVSTLSMPLASASTLSRRSSTVRLPRVLTLRDSLLMTSTRGKFWQTEGAFRPEAACTESSASKMRDNVSVLTGKIDTE